MKNCIISLGSIACSLFVGMFFFAPQAEAYHNYGYNHHYTGGHSYCHYYSSNGACYNYSYTNYAPYYGHHKYRPHYSVSTHPYDVRTRYRYGYKHYHGHGHNYYNKYNRYGGYWY